jgi:hypothetical protein
MKRLEIVPVGNAEFPRFIIQDTGGLVFDGEKTVDDRKKAVVFAEVGCGANLQRRGTVQGHAAQRVQRHLERPCPGRRAVHQGT